MDKYRLIIKEEDNKLNTIFSSDFFINTMHKDSDLIHFLKDGYFNDAILFINDKEYDLKDSYKLIVNINEIITITFVFKDKNIDLDSLKSSLLDIKELPVDNDLNKQIKINKLINIINQYHPLFAYSKDHLSYIYNVDNLDFLFINKSLIKNKVSKYIAEDDEEEIVNKKENNDDIISKDVEVINKQEELKAKKQKEIKIKPVKEKKVKEIKPNKVLIYLNQYIFKQEAIYFVSSLILAMFSSLTCYLVKENNYLYILTIIFIISSLAMISVLNYEFYKANDTKALFLRKHLDSVFFGFIALLLSTTGFILISKYLIKIEENNNIFLYAGIGAAISIGLVGLSTLIYYIFIKSKINKSNKTDLK